jgi:hypothetical protein
MLNLKYLQTFVLRCYVPLKIYLEVQKGVSTSEKTLQRRKVSKPPEYTAQPLPTALQCPGQTRNNNGVT